MLLAIEVPFKSIKHLSLFQLHESLAQLIIENLTIERWLLKFNTTVCSNGIAYCDIMNLKCFVQIYKEAVRYGDKWSQRWAHVSYTLHYPFILVCFQVLTYTYV